MKVFKSWKVFVFIRQPVQFTDRDPYMGFKGLSESMYAGTRKMVNYA